MGEIGDDKWILNNRYEARERYAKVLFLKLRNFFNYNKDFHPSRPPLVVESKKKLKQAISADFAEHNFGQSLNDEVLTWLSNRLIEEWQKEYKIKLQFLIWQRFVDERNFVIEEHKVIPSQSLPSEKKSPEPQETIIQKDDAISQYRI